MTLVDDRRGSLKTSPYFLAYLLGYRTNAFPLFVHFLKTAECREDITRISEFLSLYAERFFLFKILLKIIVAKLLVDFESVIELLAYCAVSLPENVDFLRIHCTYFLELSLKILKQRVLLTDTVGIRRNGIHLIKDFLFLCKVVCHLLITSHNHNCTSFFLNVQKFFQFGLKFIGCRFISSRISIVIDKLL